MGEQKREIIRAVAFALILAVVLAGASYYLLPPEVMPTPAPVPTTTPPPIPTPTPIPTPGPQPTPFHPTIDVEVFSLEGFSYTEIGNAYPEKVPVLHQGKSANITLNVYSHHNESCDISLSFYYYWGEGLEGVNCRFQPSTLELPPEGVATSTLTLEADSDAPSNLYNPTLGIQIEGFPGGYGKSLGFNILVFPTTPSYIFSVYAEELPTPPVSTPIPTPPPPTNETTPPPYPTLPPTPATSPVPTPIPTPPPPPPWEPEIQIERGGEAQILFYILTQIENPSLTLNVTYQSGELPEGINADIIPDPLEASQNSLTVWSLLVTLTADSQTPEETYEITANGSVDSITFERIFHLKVTS